MPVIVLDQSLVRSKSWLELSGTAHCVYLLFRCRCKVEKYRCRKKHGFTIANNGQLVFTYAEAEQKYGILRGRFSRAISELIYHGFIDITATGQGTYKVTTLYAISDRWQAFGTPDFKTAQRPEANFKNPGFRPGNKLWLKALKKKISAINRHGTVFIHKHGGILAMRTNRHGQKERFMYKCSKGKWLCSQIA
jgi:hypothetical protein